MTYSLYPESHPLAVDWVNELPFVRHPYKIFWMVFRDRY